MVVPAESNNYNLFQCFRSYAITCNQEEGNSVMMSVENNNYIIFQWFGLYSVIYNHEEGKCMPESARIVHSRNNFSLPIHSLNTM